MCPGLCAEPRLTKRTVTPAANKSNSSTCGCEALMSIVASRVPVILKHQVMPLGQCESVQVAGLFSIPHGGPAACGPALHWRPPAPAVRQMMLRHLQLRRNRRLNRRSACQRRASRGTFPGLVFDPAKNNFVLVGAKETCSKKQKVQGQAKKPRGPSSSKTTS